MESIDMMGLLRGAIAILTLAAFLGICWWAYRPGNRARFEEDAWLAFDESEVETASDFECTFDGAFEGEREER